MLEIRNKLIVFTGPSGAGKDTIEAELIKTLPLQKVVTTTTRPMREGEVDGVDRHFVSKKEFKGLIKDDALIEHNYFNDHYYGTQYKDMDVPRRESKIPIIDVDPNEANNIQNRNPDALVIFLKPASLEVLKKRMIIRGQSMEEIALRMELAKKAMEKESVFSYSVTNKEGHLQDAVKNVKKIVLEYLDLGK
ncbi:MAG: guanylate kinase [Patescibacteria group bacterium]|nr:guanylate kinase [Patescibacteria group bacterium]